MKSNNLVWSWRNARFTAVIAAIPVFIIATCHVEAGLSLLLGALPASIMGLPPTRKQRRKIIVIGILIGVFLMLGSFMAQWAIVAIPGMFLLAFGAALLLSRRTIGIVALTICLPIAGVGLSYPGLVNSVPLALLYIIGSVVAYGWSLCFKEHKPEQPAERPLMSSKQSRNYGLRLGLMAATATTMGFALGFEHIGWLVGAALFVMRPRKEVQKLRSVGRAISVFVGALIASWLLSQSLPPVVIASLCAISLVTASATISSRWYISPAFTTFLVFWSVLYGDPTSANIEYHFDERVLGTLLGVSLAYFFGILIPNISSRIRQG